MSLGKECFNDRENYAEDVKDVDLYKMVTFNCELPGTSQLEVALMDADIIGTCCVLLCFVMLCVFL